MAELVQVRGLFSPQIGDLQLIARSEKDQDDGSGNNWQVTEYFHQGFTVIPGDKKCDI